MYLNKPTTWEADFLSDLKNQHLKKKERLDRIYAKIKEKSDPKYYWRHEYTARGIRCRIDFCKKIIARIKEILYEL